MIMLLLMPTGVMMVEPGVLLTNLCTKSSAVGCGSLVSVTEGVAEKVGTTRAYSYTCMQKLPNA